MLKEEKMILVYCNQCGKEVYRTRGLPNLWDILTESEYFGMLYKDYGRSWDNGESICKKCRDSNKHRKQLGLPLPRANAFPSFINPLEVWMYEHDESDSFIPKDNSDYYGCDDGGTDHWGGAGPDCSSKGVSDPSCRQNGYNLSD